MVLNTDMQEELDALNHAARLTSSLCQRLVELNIPITEHPLPHNIDTLIPDLDLSVPHEIIAPILTLDIPENLRQTLSGRLNIFIQRLQEQYNATYRRSCIETFRGMNSIADFNAVHQAYQALAQRQYLPTICSQVNFIMNEVAKHQNQIGVGKRPFNTDFTPALEQYFELNGYPSVAHRSILAQKSGMLPRQIEVWFQNHRNRARKEKKNIHRLDSDFPLRQALGVLLPSKIDHQHRLPTPSDDETTNGLLDKSNTSTSSSPQNSILATLSILDDTYNVRPAHAFPARMNDQYPDPFPADGRIFKFPSPIWRRRPETAPIISVVVDMDEFTRAFHLKLNFSENPRRRGTTPSKREPPPSQPWFHATTTKPSTAPHPALIQNIDVPRPASPSLDTFIGKPIVFGPNFWRVDTSTAFLPVPPGEAPARKTRSLPRRIPSRSPSSSFGSRTSSFSSDTSSGSSAFSSSSSYSSSPELPTPPPLPDRDLPVFHDDAQQQDYLFDFSQTDLDADYPSASQTFDFSFNDPSLNKIQDLSCFSLHFPDFNNLAQIVS